MDNIPHRLSIATPYRKLLSILERWLSLPKISPSYYDVVGILFSLLFFVVHTNWLRILIISLILLTDWLDGATARQCGTCSIEGYIMDVIIDRASEGLIFVAASDTTLGKFFFLLWLVNLICAFYSLRSNRHVSLPLRFLFMICLVILPNV